jgi:anti-anti-sigma factor
MIDGVTTSALRVALQPFRQRSQRLILDLREVAEIESAGLELLTAVSDELKAIGGQLRVIVQPGSQVEHTLLRGGLDRRLPIFHTAPQALAGRRPEACPAEAGQGKRRQWQVVPA